MSFLQIEKCWNSPEERTLEALQALYADPVRLKLHVKHVMGSRLPAASISGKKVLLKPNWVRQESRPGEALCLRTHDALLLAVLEEILTQKPSRVMIGDAPIQGCDWEVMVHWVKPEIEKLSSQYGIPVELRDFRRVIFNPRSNQFEDRSAGMVPGVLFDLGKESFLEPVCDDRRRPFRILQYPASFLAENHRAGVHRYCITPEFFEADTIITLPKIKTHEKVGLTNSLKILVGINGDKNYLPHHRIGGTSQGGDCYAGRSLLRHWAEAVFDFANTRIGCREYRLLYIAGRILWKLSRPQAEHPFSAGWFGNDTTWRMVMDLNRIARHGKADGSIDKNFRRQIFSLSDGIVAGEGNGPLRPSPLPLGFLMFSDDSALADAAAAVLMGISGEHVPLLKQLHLTEDQKNSVFSAEGPVSWQMLEAWHADAQMPTGWIHYRNMI